MKIRNIVVMMAVATTFALGLATATNVSADEFEGSGGSYVYVMGNGKAKFEDVNPGDTVTGEIEVRNTNDSARTIRVSIAPYSRTEDTNLPLYSGGNYRTTITDWISLASDEYTIPANTKIAVNYSIKVPSDWEVGGGQAAAIMFHVEGSSAEQENITAESSFAYIVLMNVAGDDAREEGQIVEWKVPRFVFDKNEINVDTKIKNAGNVIFEVEYKTVIYDIIQNNRQVFEDSGTRETLPDFVAEINQVWENGPYFGLFRVESEITLNSNTEEFSKWVLILPLWFVIIVVVIIILLIWAIILRVKQHREKNKRLKS